MKKIKVVQYDHAPVWMEWLGYIGAVSLLVAGILTGEVLWYAAITGWLMYWNYRMYRIINKFVDHANAIEISNLLVNLALEENNKHKEGTISDTDGLTKEDEGDEG